MSFDFVVNLEAFSRFEVDGNDVDGLKKLAKYYDPIRLSSCWHQQLEVNAARTTLSTREPDLPAHEKQAD